MAPIPLGKKIVKIKSNIYYIIFFSYKSFLIILFNLGSAVIEGRREDERAVSKLVEEKYFLAAGQV